MCAAATVAVATAVALIAGATGNFAGAEGLSVAYDAAGDAPTISDNEGELHQPGVGEPDEGGRVATYVGGGVGEPEGDGGDARTISGPKIGLPSDADNITYTSADGTIATRARAAFECDLGTFECEDARLNSAWYYVSRSNTIEHRIDVAGDATIVLCPEATLTCPQGIHVPWGSSLTIYGLNGQDGSLVADASDVNNAAGIGGNEDESNGPITICGGSVTAKGGENGAGIGGGDEGHGNDVIIYGGTVNATGGEDGAGIGGGDDAHGSNVTIHGGTVTATGTACGAGIGAGGDQNAQTFTMYGGDVTATGGSCTWTYRGAAGIGGGSAGNGGTVDIQGGKLTVTSGTSSAGIGGGNKGDGGTVSIKNAEVHVKAKEQPQTNECGAGIGQGYGGAGCAKVTIENTNLEVTSDARAAIGGREVVIRDSHVKATVVYGGATAISVGGDMSAAGTDVTIEGNSVVECKTHLGGALGAGHSGDKMINSVGQLHLANHLKVTSHDNGDETASVNNRELFCHYCHHVTIEPCDHSGVTYTADAHGHTPRCKHCRVELNGAHEHEYGEDHLCTTCHFEELEPRFVKATPMDDGSCGLVFWYRFPKGGDYSDCQLRTYVDGKNHRRATVSYGDAIEQGELRGFAVELSHLEMGEQVSARMRRTSGDQERQCACLGDLLAEQAEGGSSVSEAEARLAQAELNSSYYMQLFLAQANGWKYDDDYVAVDKHFSELNDVDAAKRALAGYANDKQDANGLVKSAAMTVTFGSQATLEIVFTPQDGLTFKPLAASAGRRESRDVQLEALPDGRVKATVRGIRPIDFDMPIFVSGRCAGHEGDFSATTSVLGYAHAVMNSKKASKEAKDAMAALYWLYQCSNDCARA